MSTAIEEQAQLLEVSTSGLELIVGEPSLRAIILPAHTTFVEETIVRSIYQIFAQGEPLESKVYFKT